MSSSRFAEKLHKDNKGLSLVELIVTILLMSVISSMIVLFISSSRSNYEFISTESTLQTEAQAATGFIYDILLEAEEVDYYGGDGTLSASSVGGTDTDGTIKVLSAKNGQDCLVVLYEQNSQKLRYTSLSAIEVSSGSAVSALSSRSAAGDKLLGDKYSLLADHVTSFNFAKVTASGGAVSGPYYSNVNLEFEYAGRLYKTSIDVNGRNMKGGI